jgi:hypothetical protein
MRAGRKLDRQFEPEPLVDWRAARIEDPVEKLTYLRRKMEPRPQPGARAGWRRFLIGGLMAGAIFLLLPAHGVISDVSPQVSRRHSFPERLSNATPQSFQDVWLVEENEKTESYSNGLQIDNTYLVTNQKRFYQALKRTDDFAVTEEWKSEPVGIVFHTTESHQAPFEKDQNHQLKRITNGLLEGVRDRQSYNFVIDRFGRVFRVVDESNAANHAGNSIWGDDEWAYLNLNQSFLGVAFEAASGGVPGAPRWSQAQLHSGRILTEYLRSKYRIPTTNCVTHAQVSVNPSNGLIGYHTDGASAFPFEELGLPDNYRLSIAAIHDFGFEHDAALHKAIGDPLWPGLGTAEQRFMKAAVKEGRTLAAHRAHVRARYSKLISSLKLTGALDESSNVANNSQ